MKKVERRDILDYVTYEEQRTDIRNKAMNTKALRRVHLGENLTFLFENTETIRYQILEMVRAEKMVKEADIQREIDTYNELLGNTGSIGCTLLVEIADPQERAEKLTSWVGLPGKIFLKLKDGSKTFAEVDERQNEAEKISSVQFLRFDCRREVPVAIGCEHAEINLEIPLSDASKKALAKDLTN